MPQLRSEKVMVLSIDPLLNCCHDFFKFGNKKKSLGARSGEYAGCGINTYPFRSTASIASNFASVNSRVVLLQQNTFREFTSAFFADGGSQLV